MVAGMCSISATNSPCVNVFLLLILTLALPAPAVERVVV